MNEQEIIEEMARDIGEKQTFGELCIGAISDKSLQYEGVSNKELAEHLTKKGWRKVSEVASKIIREIRNAIFAHGTKYAMKELAKIEKEYMGE